MTEPRTIKVTRTAPTETEYVIEARFASVGDDGLIYAMHYTLAEAMEYTREHLSWENDEGAHVINLSNGNRVDIEAGGEKS